VLCGRTAANTSDFWVLRYSWDRLEQIGPLGVLVNGLLEQSPSEAAHPRAKRPEQVDAEALAKELANAETILSGTELKLLEASRLKDRLQTVADRAAWVTDSTAREHLLKRVAQLQSKLA
jgi:MoxR-like ATPase